MQIKKLAKETLSLFDKRVLEIEQQQAIESKALEKKLQEIEVTNLQDLYRNVTLKADENRKRLREDLQQFIEELQKLDNELSMTPSMEYRYAAYFAMEQEYFDSVVANLNL